VAAAALIRSASGGAAGPDWVWLTIAGLLVASSAASGVAGLRAGDLVFRVERPGELGRRVEEYRWAGRWRRRVAAAKLLPTAVPAVALTDGEWRFWLAMAGLAAFLLVWVERGVLFLTRELVSAVG
jgi:hypothetical protein